MIAAPSATLDRLQRRSLTLAPPFVLGGLVVVSTVARMLLALPHRSAGYFPDEWIYAGLSRSLAHGHLTIHGDAAHFPAILQPILAAPLWHFFPIDTAYRLIQLENAIAASAVVVPVYLLAKLVGLSRNERYLCCAYALLVPTLTWIPVTISDFIAYPLALGAIAVAVKAVDEPTTRRQVAFLVLVVLATLARVQYFVIAVSYIVAALWIERSHAFRRHKIAFAAIVPVALGAVVGALGYYGVSRGSFSLSTLTWIPLQAFFLGGVTGGILVPGAIAGVVRAKERAHRAFALVASSFAVGLLAETSVSAAAEGRFRERYLFVLLPLLAISFLVHLRRGRPHRWLLLGVAAAMAAAAAYLPVTRYADAASHFDSQSMIAVSWLRGATSGTLAALVVAITITVGAALGLATGRRVVAGAAIPFAMALAVLVSIPATQADYRVNGESPARYGWVAKTVPHAHVTLLATPASGTVPLLEALYWNTNVDREVTLRPALGSDRYARTRLVVGRHGALLNVGGYFLYDKQGSQATFHGASLVRGVGDLLLYRVTGQPRFGRVVLAQLSTGFLSPYSVVRVWDTQSRAQRRTAVSFSLTRPAATPPAQMFVGNGKFTVAPGSTARFTCTSARLPMELVIRSWSAIPDAVGRPVTVVLSHLRNVPVRVGAKAGCVRTA